MGNFVTSAVRRLADWVELNDAANGHPLLQRTIDDMGAKFDRLNVNLFDVWDDAQQEIERRKAQRLISMQFRAARKQKAKELAELDAALTA